MKLIFIKNTKVLLTKYISPQSYKCLHLITVTCCDICIILRHCKYDTELFTQY